MSTTMPIAQRRLEFWAVVLISVAAVLSAWCAYESARWMNVQSRSYAQANAQRARSLRESGIANRQIMVDVNLFVAYESALASGNPQVAASLVQRFPARLKSALDAWLKTDPRHNARAPSSPFEMEQYRLVASDNADALEQQALSTFDTGVMASEDGNRYVLMTVIFAGVSFLGGVGSKFDSRRIEIATLSLGSVVLLVAAAILISYPIR